MGWKLSFFVLLAIFLIGCFFYLITLVDHAESFDGDRHYQMDTEIDLRALSLIVNKNIYQKKEIIAAFVTNKVNHHESYGNKIELGRLELTFNSKDSLIHVDNISDNISKSFQK